MNIFKKVKYFIQRGKRGWSDEDWWQMNTYIAKMMPPLLRRLAKENYGCPGEFWDETAVNNECHKWTEALEEMAQGFEAEEILEHRLYKKKVQREDGNWEEEVDRKAMDNAFDKQDKGLLLFAKYFRNLWD